MRSGIFLLVVILALAALAALLWWRFRGDGQPAATSPLLATRNHHSLRTFHYGPAAAAPSPVAAPPQAGAARAQLLPEEDRMASTPKLSAGEEQTTPLADSPPLAAEQTQEVGADAPVDKAPRPASSRHAAGALASLLDVQEEAGAPILMNAEPAPEPETEEGPAEALFHNPITAPAPTANDQANRAAEIALRQQRRARMSADAAAQRAALSGLFPGAGSPIPTAKPS